MLKLKLQYLGHLMQRASSSEKTLMLGKTEGRRSGQQRIRWLDAIIESINMSISKLLKYGRTEKKACCSPWGYKESDMAE